MNTIDSVILEVHDPNAAETFYEAAFGLDHRLGVRSSAEPSTGFRGFTLSLIVAQPSTVDSLVGTALDAGATTVKPAKKGMWGYGGVVQAPDGTLLKVATSSKKETGAPERQVDDVVLLLGVEDVKASKQFYVDHGLTVAKSFGSKYVEFEAPSDAVKLALYGRKAAAKDAGVAPEGSGSHRLVVRGSAGQFTDPDGFRWEAASA